MHEASGSYRGPVGRLGREDGPLRMAHGEAVAGTAVDRALLTIRHAGGAAGEWVGAVAEAGPQAPAPLAAVRGLDDDDADASRTGMR